MMDSLIREPISRLHGLAVLLLLVLLVACAPVSLTATKAPLTQTPAQPTAVTTIPTSTPTSKPTSTVTLPPTPTARPTSTATSSPQPTATARPIDTSALANPARNPFVQLVPRDAGATGQPGTVVESESPLVYLYPELRQAAAPVWLREGVRVTYYAQGASVAQTPNEKSTAWAGLIQYDLVALDAKAAVTSAKFYLMGSNNVVTPSFVVSSLGIPGVGDYWVDPKVLQTAERVTSAELAIVHMPTTISGKNYRAVRFQYNPAGAEYVWMYEEGSGILLFYRHAIGRDTDARKLLADITLINQRQLSLPWQAASVPAWVAAGARLRYEGSYTPLVMGSPATSFSYAASVEIVRSYPRWCEYVVTDYLAGRMNTTAKRISGVAQFSDALWLPREALQALREGQVLDRDPVTGAEITVSRSVQGALLLTESGSAYRVALTYGSDGALLSLEQEINTGIAGSVAKLGLVGR